MGVIQSCRINQPSAQTPAHMGRPCTACLEFSQGEPEPGARRALGMVPREEGLHMGLMLRLHPALGKVSAMNRDATILGDLSDVLNTLL